MRQSATFPAGDTSFLKRKLVSWAGNFACAVVFDHNQFSQPTEDTDYIVAADTLDAVTFTPENIFPSVAAFHDLHKDWLFGYLTYDVKNEIEPGVLFDNPCHIDGIQFPIAHFFRPKHIIRIAKDLLTIESVESPDSVYASIMSTDFSTAVAAKSANLKLRMQKEDYFSRIGKLQQHIVDGDVYEVNFCQEFYAEAYDADPVSLFNKLTAINPAPFATFLKQEGKYLIAASPERFIRKQNNTIFSQPMKGTLARAHAGSDLATINKLRNDPKERSENVMIVDLVRNDLARSAITGSVKVDELFGIYSFATVHQMVSTISAELSPHLHFMDAIRNAFPMGSMTGAPKIKAMQLISEYEMTKRGLYSGTVGYITPDGDFDFCVVIRSLLYNSDNRYLSFQTGSAITHDSIPEKEYEESMLKAKALIAALQ